MTFYNNRPQIKIGDKWSYDVWGLLLAKGWSLDAAKPKTSYVEIPASDGSIDLSEVLAGEPRYLNRALSFGLVFTQAEDDWESLRQTVENYCSGQRMRLTLPHDPRHYLLGRITSGDFERQAGSAVLYFDVQCDPWRYKNNQTVVALTTPGGGTITSNLRNERRRVIPEITTTGSANITINGITQSVSAGTFKFTDFILDPGNNPVTVAGATGVTATFTYQEAGL